MMKFFGQKQQWGHQPYPRIFWWGTIILLIAASGLVYLIVSSLIFLQEKNFEPFKANENEIWAAYQVQAEYLKLKETLIVELNNPVEWSEISVRYEVLLSRTDLFKVGILHISIIQNSEAWQLLQQVTKTIEGLEPQMEQAAQGNRRSISLIVEKFDSLEPKINRFVRSVNEFDADKLVKNRELLKDYFNQVKLFLASLFIAIAALIGLLLWLLRLMATEIKERKQAENQLQQINEELISANKELKDTQSQLIQSTKLASIGELATGIAHELNQPLTYIRNSAQTVMMSGVEELDLEEVQETLELVELGTERMMLIINHLRSFARQTDTEFQSVDVHEIIENSLILLNEQLKLRNIQLEKKYSPSVPRIEGNPHQLEQVFINMLSNARDALDGKKEACITIQTDNGQQDNDAQAVVVSFIDNGCGIDPNHLEKIFDPFFSTKEEGKGTGLGLSISYGIIQEHRGTINVFSGDQGTTFEIVLPMEGKKNSAFI